MRQQQEQCERGGIEPRCLGNGRKRCGLRVARALVDANHMAGGAPASGQSLAVDDIGGGRGVEQHRDRKEHGKKSGHAASKLARNRSYWLVARESAVTRPKRVGSILTAPTPQRRRRRQ